MRQNVKAFIKLFDTPQRSEKIKLKSIYSLSLGAGREGLFEIIGH